MNGSRSALRTWARNITWISGRPGIMHEQRGEADEERQQPVERGASRQFQSTPVSQPNASQVV